GSKSSVVQTQRVAATVFEPAKRHPALIGSERTQNSPVDNVLQNVAARHHQTHHHCSVQAEHTPKVRAERLVWKVNLRAVNCLDHQAMPCFEHRTHTL